MADEASEKESPPSSDLRRTRRLQAAYSMVSSIRKCKNFRWSLEEDDARARAVEIVTMLALLKEGDLPGDRANSKGAEQSESVRSLLLSSVRPEAEYNEFSLALDMLERVLNAQLIVLGASHTAAPVKETHPDAATLTNLTEKFYGSTAFKIACGILVSAALFAGFGALFGGTKVVEDAKPVAQAAGNSEQRATAYRDDTAEQLPPLYDATLQETARLRETKKQIDIQESALNEEIIPRIKQLRAELSVVQPTVCDRSALSGSPEAHCTQAESLKRPNANIDAHATSKQIGMLSESDLTPQHWHQIQQVLADKQFYKGKIDGKPGSPARNFKHMTGTRRAISKWQRTLSQSQTGSLTPEQIQQLLASDLTMR